MKDLEFIYYKDIYYIIVHKANMLYTTDEYCDEIYGSNTIYDFHQDILTKGKKLAVPPIAPKLVIQETFYTI